jgi:hypothetical protein
MLPSADPDGRAAHIGCGAALFNLRIAAAVAGLAPEVRLLVGAGNPVTLCGLGILADQTAEAIPP